MSQKTTVHLTLEGNLPDGQMLVVCGESICTAPVPKLAKGEPYPVYQDRVVYKTDHNAMKTATAGTGLSILSLILAGVAIYKAFKEDDF